MPLYPPTSGGTPGGADTQVQFNDSGAFGGDAGLTYNKTTDVLTVNGGTVINESGADSDTRIEGDTDANTLYLDASTNRVGLGTATPAEKLNVIGSFQVDDADIQTKGYRFRTSGANLDLDASGADLYLSVFSAADFGGTQRDKIRLESGADIGKLVHLWQFTPSPSGATHHVIDGDANGDVVFNEDAQGDADFRVEGDTDVNLLMVDGSADKVGIGVAAPAEKLEVAGNILTSGYLEIDSTPATDHTGKGWVAKFVANEAQAIGDVCYINSVGEMQLADADAIATAVVAGMCIDATIAADATGNYLLFGVARDDTWAWTVGGLVYLSTTGTSGNTLTQTAPSATDDCVVVVGVATHADRLLFNPSFQGIVEVV